MTASELRLLIGRALPGSVAVEPACVAPVARVKGSYALLLRLEAGVQFTRARASVFLAGWFVYAGSAYGRGGMGARLSRHFQRDKAVRWHIDELTNSADAIMAFAVPDGRECDIVDRLLSTGSFETALPGFGSSDCRRCAAHLLQPYRS